MFLPASEEGDEAVARKRAVRFSYASEWETSARRRGQGSRGRETVVAVPLAELKDMARWKAVAHWKNGSVTA